MWIFFFSLGCFADNGCFYTVRVDTPLSLNKALQPFVQTHHLGLSITTAFAPGSTQVVVHNPLQKAALLELQDFQAKTNRRLYPFRP
jgi:hypothetical protein